MAIPFDTSLQAIVQRTQGDVYNSLPGSNPYLRASLLQCITKGYSGRIYDFDLQGNQLQQELFPDTASQFFIETRWGSYKGLTPNSATQAAGNITVSGVVDTIIPIDTLFQSTNTLQYKSLEAATILENTIDIVSINSATGLATVVVDGELIYANNTVVTISGADQAEYNITAAITVIGLNEFQYQIAGDPDSPATGDIIGTANVAEVSIQSLDFGINTNLQAGSPVNLSTPISGANNTAYVQFSEVSGGFDAEIPPAYRTRVLESYFNPEAQFNAANITATAKEIPGVTRVWVKEFTPVAGQVTIYFVEDNNDDILPPAQDVATVHAALSVIAPSNTYPGDIIVNDPLTGIDADFIFTSLSPDTPSMRTAINENLRDYFTTRNEPGQDIPQYGYDAQIYQTIDTVTGEFVESFSLSSPIGDIEVGVGQIAVLGDVIFE